MQEKNWSEVTRLPEEDLALVSTVHRTHGLDRRNLLALITMSAMILTVYLTVNYRLYPAYPVVAFHAEQNAVFTAHYPPFRTAERANYLLTEAAVQGALFTGKSPSGDRHAGFALVSVPLTLIWGKAGPYFTNAFLLWLSALVFFAILSDIVSFPAAVGATLFLAFATPNLFYAASAFSEPLGQLLALLALFLFLQGNAARRGWPWIFGAGGVAGLTLFVQSSLAFIAVPFFVSAVLESRVPPWRDRNTLALAAGFLVPCALFLFSGHGAALPFRTGIPPVTGVLLGLWRVFAESPHGLIPLVPALLLAPPGFIALWRGEQKLIAITAGTTVAVVLLAAVTGNAPVDGESLGVRALIPVLPFLLLPVTYLWDEGLGERFWIGALAVLSLYTGVSGLLGGHDGIPGRMQDRDARAIILSRKGLLPRADGNIAPEKLTARFTRALRERNLEHWLETLSPESRREITGIERGVFESFTRRIRSRDGSLGTLIAGTDSSGVTIIIPDLAEEDAPDAGGAIPSGPGIPAR